MEKDGWVGGGAIGGAGGSDGGGGAGGGGGGGASGSGGRDGGFSGNGGDGGGDGGGGRSGGSLLLEGKGTTHASRIWTVPWSEFMLLLPAAMPTVQRSEKYDRLAGRHTTTSKPHTCEPASRLWLM